jgi:hypothetical protein
LATRVQRRLAIGAKGRALERRENTERRSLPFPGGHIFTCTTVECTTSHQSLLSYRVAFVRSPRGRATPQFGAMRLLGPPETHGPHLEIHEQLRFGTGRGSRYLGWMFDLTYHTAD